MTRVATIPMQQTLANAMQRSQQNLSTSQLQLTNGKKANDFSGLGIDAVRTLSARTMLSQQLSYQAVGQRVSTTLALYDANLNQIDDSIADLRYELLSSLGTGNSPSLQDVIKGAFNDVRAALNATEAGVPLFAGSQIDKLPMVPTTLDELSAMAPEDIFVDDQVRHTSRVADGVDMQFGISASEVGTKLMPFFKTLADAGPYGDYLTDAQMDAIRVAIGQIDEGLVDVRTINGENGRKINQAETYLTRSADREILLTKVIGEVEDADLAQVAYDISQRQTVLEASYSVFSQLSSLSLTRYLD